MAESLRYQVDHDIKKAKSLLKDILDKELAKSYISTSWKDDELTIRIDKGGTSEFKFNLTEHANGKCLIQETKRAVALLHKPFAGEVQKTVDRLLVDKMGAKKAEA